MELFTLKLIISVVSISIILLIVGVIFLITRFVKLSKTTLNLDVDLTKFKDIVFSDLDEINRNFPIRAQKELQQYECSKCSMKLPKERVSYTKNLHYFFLKQELEVKCPFYNPNEYSCGICMAKSKAQITKMINQKCKDEKEKLNATL